MDRKDEARVATLERQTLNLHERVRALESQFADAPAAAVTTLAPPPDPADHVAALAPPPDPADRVAALAPPPDPAERVAATAPPPDLADRAPATPTGAWRSPMPPVSTSPPSTAAASRGAAGPGREGFDLEDLLGGRVLAWTGGVAVVAGIAFLLAVAISRGWIGPGGRTLLAGMLSLGLVGAGAWLYERAGRTDASLAALSAGIAGLFITVAVGGPVYGVLPVGAALALAFASGALATAFAVRWEAPGIGALGIVGGLLAPVLAGAPSTGATLALLWIAAASGAAVLVWQRWDWLAFAVFATTLPQWAWWFSERPSGAAIVVVLSAFGALYVAAAIGFELRVPVTRLRPASALLLTANATALAIAGWYGLQVAGETTAGRVWIGGLALSHLAVGLATRATRVNRDIRLLALVLGVVLADITAGLVLQGPVLALAWATTTAGFGFLARRVLSDAGADSTGRDATLLGLGLGGHLLLTCIQALTQAPPDALARDHSIAVGAYAAIAATACAAFVAGRFVDGLRRDWSIALDVVAMTGAAYLTAVALDGPMLAAAYAAEAVALATIGRRERDEVATWGAGAYVGLALGYGLVVVAPVDALVAGLDDVPGSALALGAAALAALRCAQLAGRAGGEAEPGGEGDLLLARGRAILAAGGAITLLYLASTALVTAFQPGEGTPDAGLFELGVRQLGQLLLSALWAMTGLTALVLGLRRDDRAWRLGALALLLATVGKVFLYDLAALTSLYRVGSFIGLGLLLLVAAGLWQRMRPRPRAAPAAGIHPRSTADPG
ncbi:MAG TPA: DUF2339 domain-containing protein [Solirubrobacteraceae bacterium]|nr:DUF2339 domain-containing protein [Solirubrobacteraceae bacterium]